MNKFLTLVVAALIGITVGSAFMMAFNAGCSSALADTGSGSGSGSAVAPADQLHDPLSAPQASYDDLKAARAMGWAAAVLAFLTMAARLLGRMGGFLSFLAEGKTALVVGAVGALGAAGYNAIALGGSWYAAIFAAIVAGAAYWDSHAGEKPAPTTATV